MATPQQTFVLDSLWSDNPKTVTLTATLEPVLTMIPDIAGVAWQPNDVESVAFPLDGSLNLAPGRNFGQFFQQYAAAELNSYIAQSTISAANAACLSLRSKIDTIGLSDRDEALVLWAELQRNPNFNDSDNLYSIQCMRSVAQNLPASLSASAGPVVPASTHDMKGSESDLVDFFLASTWDARSEGARDLFSYPLKFDDPNHLIFATADHITSNTDWLQYMPTRDAPILAHIGCFAYFANSGPGSLASKYGGQSFAAAVAQLLGSGPARNAAMIITFAPVKSNGEVLIDQITVSPDFASDIRSQLVAQFKNRGNCGNGWMPPLIFPSSS